MSTTPGQRHDQRFPKRARLRLDKEFEAVFQSRQSSAGRWLIVYGRRNELGMSRLGLTVSRRLGPAVVRNRFKRLCREAFRTSYSDHPPGSWDWIVLPRLPLPRTSDDPRTPWRLADLRAELLAQMQRIARRHKAE